MSTASTRLLGALFVVGHGLERLEGRRFSLCRWLTNVATFRLRRGMDHHVSASRRAHRPGHARVDWLLVHAEAGSPRAGQTTSDSAELTEVDLLSLLNDPELFLQGVQAPPGQSRAFCLRLVGCLQGFSLQKQTGLSAAELGAGLTGLAAFILACFMVTTQRVLNLRPQPVSNDCLHAGLRRRGAPGGHDRDRPFRFAQAGGDDDARPGRTGRGPVAEDASDPYGPWSWSRNDRSP